MKKIITSLSIFAVIISFILASSCRKEVETPYRFGVSQISITDSSNGATVFILRYLEINEFIEIESYDNKAKSTEEAIRKNDNEAKRDFDKKIQKLNLLDFKQMCALEGYKNVKGSFTYALWKDESGNLAEKTIILE